ncbi:annexin A4-like isoform X1 [Petromyzon marinus]|uniref:Annexin n=1 Tax=Petromyzon marinus TaxID=7757 RepID=A0AAJ7WQ46_PETMA|nr:annexin A7-like isoform X1 [Petromyzon marinus]XP_032805673.1 annexin A7-like isoform X1 [Petromyzon marinus]
MSYPGYPGGNPSPYQPAPGYPGAAYPQVGPGGYPGSAAAYPPAGAAYPPGAGGYAPAAGGYPPNAGAYQPTAGPYGQPPGSFPQYPQQPGAGYPAAGGYPTGPAGYNPSNPGQYAPQPGAGGYPGGAPYPTPGAPPYGAGPPGPQYPGLELLFWKGPAAGGFGGGYSAPPGGPGYQAAPQPGPQGGMYQNPPTSYAPSAPPTQQPSGASYAQPAYQQSHSTPAQVSYPSAGGVARGTIHTASNFNAQDDAEVLRRAMKGLGTDERALIDIIVNRSNDQRQKIKLAFKTMYGKDLIRDLRSELSGNFEEIILALFMPTTYYDAWSLMKAIKGAGTDEKVLIEIMCTRTNQEIKEIVRVYREEFNRTLEKDIRSDTSGHFKRLLISMCQGNRDESQTVDMSKAQSDAQRLYTAGEGKLGTDESTFNMILACRSFPQLQATFNEYTRMAQRDIVNTIDREFSGDIRDGMRAIVQCVRSRPAYFAERLFHSMKGLGTDDSGLIRVIVSRSEIDLQDIKQAFLQQYQKTLYTMIQGDTSGDYKRILVAIVGMN